MFKRWGISANDQWNISSELCSGVSIDNDAPIQNFNPGIKCDCSYRNATACHIIALHESICIKCCESNPGWALEFNLPYRCKFGQKLFDRSLASIHRRPHSCAISAIRSFGFNALSGEIPKELGKLTDLRNLAIGTNNFSGPLPSELGQLTKLTEL